MSSSPAASPTSSPTVKAEIEAAGGSCETHAFDIREEAQVKEAVAAIVAKNGRIHGLFNNAGGQFPAPAAAMSAKGFDVVVRNNLTGGFIVSREVFTQSMEKPRRLDREHGRRHAERLPQHGAHRRRARRHGQPHDDPGPRMGRMPACG